MSEHTLGEWFVEVGCSERKAYIYPVEPQNARHIIAEVPLVIINSKTQGAANARLIASAPKYHELLKESANFFYILADAFQEDDLQEPAEDCREMVQRIRDVLYEVEGHA